MARLTAEDFPQELLELYDHYAHGMLSKRGFLAQAAKYTIGGLTALACFQCSARITRWRSR